MIKQIIFFAFLCIFSTTAFAKTVTVEQIKTVAQSFISKRYPAKSTKSARSFSKNGSSYLAISKIVPLKSVSTGKTIAFVSELVPSGFAVLRADDLLPVLKIYSDSGTYFELPPDFLEVMEWELSTELETLNSELKKDKNFSTIYKKNWIEYLEPLPNQPNSKTKTAYEIIGPLLSTAWAQSYPYNIYGPSCGSSAPIGCVATAMSQVMRYHNYPPAILSDHTYTDSSGDCQGTYSISDAGTNNYDWENMLPTYSAGSNPEQRLAVAQLMFHSAVTVNMDFETDGSGAYSFNVPSALRTYFNYKCDNLLSKGGFSDSAWYSKINDSLALQRPAYYSFRSTSGGHAVVCDGCRNGNQFHINFGWGSSDNAWYNMDSINGYNYNHDAVLNIAPKRIELAYQNNTIKSESHGDGHLSPGETIGLEIQIANIGGINAGNVTATLSTASSYLTINSPSALPYGGINYGDSATNSTLYEVEISTNCPAGLEEIQIIMLNAEESWTNSFEILVEHLPVINVNPTNFSYEVVGISNISDYIIVSNSGIDNLLVYLFDDISSVSTNYIWAASNSSNGPTYFWRDISALGTSVSLSDNQATDLLDIGFEFPFYEKTYSQFSISANGGISFSTRPPNFKNKSLPCGYMDAPPQFIAPFWDDLDPSASGEIFYYSEANQLIVSWINVPLTGTKATKTFQVLLRKNGDVIFQYKEMNGNLESATIGIQGGKYSGYNPPEHAVQIAYNSPFVTNELAVSIHPTGKNPWIEYTPREATISPDDSNSFYFTCNSGSLTGGTYDTKLTLMHNDPTVESIEVSINLKVLKSDIIVKGKGQTISNNQNIPSLSDNTDFGKSEIDIEAITNNFSIENSGTTNLNISNFSLISGSSVFFIAESPISFIPVDSSTTFKLTFQPEELGIFTGQVQFSNSDHLNNPFIFTIVGEGIPEPCYLLFIIYHLLIIFHLRGFQLAN